MAVQNGKELDHKRRTEGWYWKSLGEGKSTSGIKTVMVKI